MYYTLKDKELALEVIVWSAIRSAPGQCAKNIYQLEIPTMQTCRLVVPILLGPGRLNTQKSGIFVNQYSLELVSSFNGDREETLT